MKYLFFISSIAFADCVNKIATSEVASAIALAPGVGIKACGKDDPCVCFDGIKWETAKLQNGLLVEDAVKKAAYEQALASKETAASVKAQEAVARRLRIKNANVAGANTVAALRAIVVDLVEEVKDR